MISLLNVIRDEDDRNTLVKKIDRMEHCLGGWYGWVLQNIDPDDKKRWRHHFKSVPRGLSRGIAYGVSPYIRLVFSEEGYLEIQTRSKLHAPWCEFEIRGEWNLSHIRAIVTGMNSCLMSLQEACPALGQELARRHEEAGVIRSIFGDV